ncbi:hypothetical protein [Streptomyces sp. NBC_00140]|uniref:hypothetical protein n=1 Tax=Streptomyces sp. NBC_00140 TaxID=2975664 RepID=UPI00224DAA5F|nr:hypothetical protein [Streptomyces sp. NBC_00140]MCX5338111.1 hypothetical protein [Streptomyces sp. NBC_00140]
MTREEALAQARTAVNRASNLAEYAEGAAHSEHRQGQAAPFAAAGAVWADAARAYAAIAAVLPEPKPTSDNEIQEV